MKKQLLVILSSLLTSSINAQRIQALFDSSWKFFKGDIANGEKQNITDGDWRTVELPHDWSIEDLPNQSDSVIGPFTTKSVGSTSTGYVVGGTAWYRKHFRLNNIAGKRISIYFDGVYMNSDVWINEHHLGNHPYGYTPFYFDLTPWLKQNGEENILAVRVRNEGRNSRWYSGSGIYRHVWLTITNAVHVRQWGVYITTPVISANTALLNVKTTIVDEENRSSVKLITTILNAKNKAMAVVETPVSLMGTNKEISQNITIPHPSLWSPESPYLYQAVTDVIKDDQILDHVVTAFGIRSLELSAEKGFLLNGKNVELRGGCMHHDNGPLGAATIDRAEERRVELLKSYGFNAVRTSHNPPSQQFLDACDRVGIIVIDEAFDHWQRPKNPQDYSLYFDTSWKKDIDAMVLRDRNHPSVVFWSIGNEINERADAPGLAIAKQLISEIKHLDNTRPVTEAICHFWDHPGYKWDTTAAAFALLDVGGYNYQWKEYEPDHKKYPQRIIMGTESVPLEAFVNWNMVEKHPYVIGDFVWTAMDYLGETGIGHTKLDSASSYELQTFPWFNAWCGDIDLIGGKKPQLYYRDIVWRINPMHMLVHAPVPAGHKEAVSYWGWPDEIPYYHFPGQEGKPLQVNVYTRYPQVRLELNGKMIDQKTVSPDNLTATFDIIYQPGSLKAIAINNGKAVDSAVLQTAGMPTQIRLTADRKNIKASRNDLSYVTAEVVDANGWLVPDAIIPLHFSITGNGEIAATASASPNDMQSFSAGPSGQKPQHKTFRGKCLIIVRPKGNAGKIILKAEGEGLRAGEVVIETK
ncbi:MAG TPA: glycoside hydrolase family 2 TIM barrel-domain containing protein [Chitinophagaceae bacterium]|jgi:beta-galactosidase|nr:glycoside hydrolase family 2 TIM barrel-domain containing protein [Chitinophagaceae bacterium]